DGTITVLRQLLSISNRLPRSANVSASFPRRVPSCLSVRVLTRLRPSCAHGSMIVSASNTRTASPATHEMHDLKPVARFQFNLSPFRARQDRKVQFDGEPFRREIELFDQVRDASSQA